MGITGSTTHYLCVSEEERNQCLAARGASLSAQ